ncbi:Coiled-coil domain-containing protein 47 [Cryptotermes secundus]|uniref:PAT complex subunit CCDC47 n=2 Tax=Cryptotermes secundus TaxID=105785 RepID=A0A2J7QZZ3_9NEOP|nr:coiled-coil domain-containing protein 47 isoform X1 [Cryptotermes secundus]XP_023707142.1 coiled-coil domain-containing protein 47 isoform X1 [Cryptotermes secundus]XP_023707143.1 coiled-coil domain-containing protein 47 isoform X1 [Cryptotermes secundus]XP_023707144.1 coiled-coil domain-containing protein 47 isoform X1 [Cryptotermes secundus]XP_023707145.1 coiled-coil domain-containing protein 47 isoform X1 [Cryptotermes secundus]PNF34144.1 Coiled-coil domain-containing protein 47 [Cryptot
MTIRLALVVLHIVLVGTQIWASSHYREDLEDNEFAEFEDFEEDEEDSVPKEADEQQAQAQKGRKGADVQELDEEEDEEEDEDVVEDDESEFDHFQDEEEFEGFDSERAGGSGKLDDKEAPKITITKVPLHFRTNWDSFYLEMLMIAGLVVYSLNFFAGKSKNNKLANAWFTSHRSLLEENFSLVGDDGKIESENPGLLKDSENLYTLWCSGRTCCEGMLVELKFLKRQDLVAVIAQLMRPSSDQVHIKVDMNKEDMDSIVFCVATKKSALRLSKDMADLSVYCPERRSVEKYGLPSNFSLLCEIVEVAASLLDPRIVAVINKYADIIDYIHFSDQFSGPKQPEDSSLTKLPDTKKLLMFGFNIPLKGKPVHEAMDQMRPLLQLVFYCMDKVKRFRLSKEAKNKAEKNRLRVEEAFLKTTHAARAEAAAARREEKKRQEKERILLEDDPEKQRKWEDREMKRQMKKKAPKMKQLKVKAL